MPRETRRASGGVPSRAAFELRDVSKLFGDLVALERIRLRIEPGESVLLYGPNGAGKTTLLRLLATLARPSEGRVLFGSEDGDPARIKSSVGFVSHSTFLYAELTARENLRFLGTLFGLANLEKKVQAALEAFGLGERSGVPVRELSRGLQQRVSLARAVLHDPPVLLLDEPFTGLDAGATQNLEALMRRSSEQGKTLVFSTHDFERGATLARRLVVLEHGRVRYDGSLSLAPLESLRIAAGSRH